MCLPSVEVVAPAGKSAPDPRRSGSGGERWDRMDPGERQRRREMVLAEVNTILREGWDALLPLACYSGTGLDAMEVATQALVRQVGGRLVSGLLGERVLATEGPAPLCPRCQHKMERQVRTRAFEGLCGPSGLERSCYRCRNCHLNLVPVDDELGLAQGQLSPALSRVAAMHAAQDPFGLSSRSINETLGTKLSRDQVYSTAEALGSVDEADMGAAQVAPPEEPGALPEGVDTLVIGADGTTSFIDDGYHEIKVGVVAPLSATEQKIDPKTGRKLLVCAGKDYCATAGSADAFFPRLALLARRAGWGAPALRNILNIGDGGQWLWNRYDRFDLPGVNRVEILDYIHATGHIWDLAPTLIGGPAIDIHAWAEPLCTALMEQGPAPVLAALDAARPQSPQAEEALRQAQAQTSAHVAWTGIRGRAKGLKTRPDLPVRSAAAGRDGGGRRHRRRWQREPGLRRSWRSGAGTAPRSAPRRLRRRGGSSPAARR